MRRIKPALTALVLLAALLLCGCFEKGGAAGEPPKDRVERVDFMKTKFTEATEVYGWFDLATLDSEGEPVTFDGEEWYQVRADLIDSYKSFEDRVNSLFGTEVSARLFGSGLYRNYVGRLYTLPASRGTDITVGDITAYDITDDTGDSLTLIVTYKRLGDDLVTTVAEETLECVYAMTESGWVFTEFTMLY